MLHHWIALAIFCILAFSGIVLTMAGIGGTFLVVLGALLYDLISWSFVITPSTLLWLTGLAVFGEILEWLITLASYKAGVKKYGLMGIIIGGIIGGILLSIIPIIGTVIGLALGAMAGAFIGQYYETKNAKRSWKAAKTALKGRIWVSASKFTIAIIQIIIVLNLIF